LRRRTLTALAAIFVVAVAQADDAQKTGAQEDLVFTEYSPLSRSTEILRRSFSPLVIAELTAAATASPKQLREQPLDLRKESFALYVPANMPPEGYSLLVFVWPWDLARTPATWQAVLDRHGTIMVSAAKSGNEQAIWDRRIPLALAGAFNIMQRYPVNPKRVYVGGLSGGSRVAMRMALDYPDLFHGALLNAGSDPIATPSAILPSAELFQQFQRESQLVYVTGEMDGVNIATDIDSRHSMSQWCVFGTSNWTMLRMGHEALAAVYLDKALGKLQETWEPNAEKLASCRASIAKELARKLQGVRDQLNGGRPKDALKELHKIDLRYGGLAAPESLGLFESLQMSLK
jgi:hypothetical protein